MLLILLALLTHAFFDGTMIVYIPLKIDSLGYYTSWVFIVGFSKGLAQTISSARFSLSESKNIPRYLVGGISFLMFTWILISQLSEVWLLVGFALFSGLFRKGIFYGDIGLVSVSRYNCLNLLLLMVKLPATKKFVKKITGYKCCIIQVVESISIINNNQY